MPDLFQSKHRIIGSINVNVNLISTQIQSNSAIFQIIIVMWFNIKCFSTFNFNAYIVEEISTFKYLELNLMAVHHSLCPLSLILSSFVNLGATTVPSYFIAKTIRGHRNGWLKWLQISSHNANCALPFWASI